MKVNGQATRTIWLAEDAESVEIIDQTKLPHLFEIVRLTTLAEAAHAIEVMLVRGAPLIGATAGYGMWLAMRQDSSDAGLLTAYERLFVTRPTAVNLGWALDSARARLSPLPPPDRAAAALALAAAICEEDVAINRGIGVAGLPVIQALAAKKTKGGPVNILTHCNAGWLATVDWGTATAPIYMAHDAGIQVHVWVDETRQSGRQPDRLGVGQPRGAAHGHRRQCRRPLHAAWPGRHGDYRY
jgi:methylthioribose-1-phosphate isomerase